MAMVKFKLMSGADWAVNTDMVISVEQDNKTVQIIVLNGEKSFGVPVQGTYDEVINKLNGQAAKAADKFIVGASKTDGPNELS